ncbi:hypothetical protein [Massilia antarctica]|uniref:hypothetical protein n=1 Tax=Massilia antarctica TaxID=2765360 RepID=UPI0022700B6B|nr:hypothetical protein [Massilia sp. H27-R4]MCY0916310.1 hypothetical protein [Massilia sp. H27-R4]
MSFESMQAAFAPDAGGATQLTAAKLASAAQLLANLNVTELDFTAARVLTGTASVTLTGQLTWCGGTGPATLVGTVVDGVDHLAFILNISQPSPWTLGVAFPTQPGMWRADKLGATPSPSYLPAVQVNRPVIQATNDNVPAQLSGGLPLTGDFTPYAAYLGTADLALRGDLVLVAGAFTFTLDALSDLAPSTIADYSGAPLSGIGLRLTNTMPDRLSTTDNAVMSALLLLVRVPVNGQPVPLTAPLMWGGGVWPLVANLWSAKPTISDGIAALARLFGLPVDDFALPPAVDFLNAFYLGELDLALVPPGSGTLVPSMQALRAVIGSDREWAPPIPYVRIANVGCAWRFNFWGSATPDISATVWGDMRLGGTTRAVRQPLEFSAPGLMRDLPGLDPGADPIALRIAVTYPSWTITGKLVTVDGDASVPLDTVFQAFNFSPPGTGLSINGLQFTATIPTQTFEAQGAISTGWSVPIAGLTFNLAELEFWLRASQSGVTGGINALLYVGTTSPTAFVVSAGYVGPSHWVFQCQMQQPMDLVTLLSDVLGVATPEPWVSGLNISLTKLQLMLDTGERTSGSSYSAEGAVVAKWHIGALGIPDLALTAEASVSKTPAMTVADRKLRGSFQINRFVVTAGVDLSRGQETYMFSVRYNQVELLATTAWVKDSDTENHQVLNLQLLGVTLGDVLVTLVRLASPASDFSLDSPWELLNKIDLSRFLLTLDKKLCTVTLSYSVEANYGFIYLKSVGVRYSYSGKGKVDIVLAGRILDQKYGYDGAPALAWDVVDDPPPAIPGKGPRFLDLRYMGVGQHVTLSKMSRYTTVGDVIAALRRDMAPVQDPDTSPMGQGQVPDLVFDESSQWMVGVDLTLIDMLSVSLVLHDPDLYGILIALSGPGAGSLAGFSIELLYRKVTDDIGVFRVQIKVPDAFRQIEMGALSITLGTITVEIYTNGNFSVDLGFPHNRSYADSFAVQVLPFIGRGGIYFAVLTGATSRRVPVISNGNFDPVLELGVGLAVGLGKEFSKGPLSAGLYVELEVIAEGVLAWFHSSDTAVANDRFYWVQGLAGITGKLYGEVDFKIVSASVSLELHAFAQLTIEAYKATIVELEVGVEAHASIKILFVRFSFSFSLTIHETFTLGSDSRTPWIVTAQPAGESAAALFTDARPMRRRTHADVIRHTRDAYLAALKQSRPALHSAIVNDGDALNWAPVAVFAGGAIRASTLRVNLLPAIDQMMVVFGPSPAPANLHPAWRVSVVLSADSGDDSDFSPAAMASGHPNLRRATTALSAHATDVPDLSLNVLIEAFLRWALIALPSDAGWPGLALAGQLDILAKQMNSAATADIGFAAQNLSNFIGKNILMRVCLPPAGTGPTVFSGAAFPMPPVASWTASGTGPSRDFSSYNPVDQTYENLLRDCFAGLSPLPAAKPAAPATGQESAASYVFRDSLLMLAKSAVEEAQTLLRAWPLDDASGKSLQDICDIFSKVTLSYVKCAGDTVAQVGAYYGMAAAEIAQLNDTKDKTFQAVLDAAPVNSIIPVLLGVTTLSVAAANGSALLNPINILAIGDVAGQVAAAPVPSQPVAQPPVAETLSVFAARYGKTAAQITVGDTLTLNKLLRAGAPLGVSTLIFANPSGLTLNLAAAVLFVRLNGVEAVPPQAYQIHAQLVSENNPTLHDIDVNTLLTVPHVRLSAIVSDTWTVQAGDTLARVAATAALLREPVPQAYTDFVTDLDAANPSHTANPVNLPQTTTAIVPGETIADLSARLLFTAADGAVALIASADILLPLATIAVPQVFVTLVQGDTLGSVAGKYGVAVETLGDRLAGQASLFGPPPTDGKPQLTIPHVPAVAIDLLVDTLQRSHAATRIAGMISNFLMHGLRPPAPPSGGAPISLHDVIGQQIAPDIAAPMTLTLASSQGWFAFYLTAVSQNETLAAFAANVGVALTQITALNPGAAAKYPDPAKMPAGLVLTTKPCDAAAPSTLVIDQTKLQYPDASVQLPTVRAPAAMPLGRSVPVTYGLQQHLVWQAGINPWGVTNAGPSLWPFPAALLSRAATPPTYGYGLTATAAQAGSAAPAAPSHYAFATSIAIAIRRATAPRTDGTSGALPNLYDVIGADTAGRQQLLQLWQDLPATGGATLYLLYEPSAQSGRSAGLASAILDPVRTFLIKSNLSTETASGRALAVARLDAALPKEGANFAQIDAAKSFACLLWECSVVDGGGYSLGYAAIDGSGLPDAIFDSGGAGKITLLAIPTAPAGLLKSYFNCAVVGDNIDPAAVNLAVQAIGSVETITRATVSPGHVGFDFALSNPDVLLGQTPTQQLARQSYSLAGYRLNATPAFAGSNTAMPVGPQVVDPLAPATGLRALRDETVWYYHQAVPISRFAVTRFAPTQAALPPPADDPYAGIAGLWSVAAPTPATTSVSLWFQDLLGNISNPGTAGVVTLAPMVGYTDPLQAPGQWPNIAAGYQVLPQGTGARLSVALGLQLSAYMPGPGDAPGAAVAAASAHRTAYQTVHFQLAQPDIASVMTSNLAMANVAGTLVPVAMDGGLLQLRALAAGAYVYLDRIAGPSPDKPGLTPVLAQADSVFTFDQILADYGLTTDAGDAASGYELLARANGAQALAAMLWGAGAAATIAIPIFQLVRDGYALNQLFADQASAVTTLSFKQNAHLPLRTGVPLNIPAVTKPVADPATQSLSQVGLALNCPAGTLALANKDTTGLLRAGFAFSFSGQVAKVGLGDDGKTVSLQAIADALTVRGFPADAVDLATLNEYAVGIFADGAQVSVAGYLVQAADTVAASGAGLSVKDLVSGNFEIPNLFDAGIPLYMSSQAGVAVPAGQRLADFAAAQGLTPVQLLQSLAAMPLAATATVLVPGAAQWAAAAGGPVPYGLRANDQLGAIAAAFSVTGVAVIAAALAEANAELPGVLTNVPITVNGVTATPAPGASITGAIAAFKAKGATVTADDIAAAIATVPGHLCAGGMLVCPYTRLGDGASLSLDAIATSFGVPAADFAAANAAMPGLILPHVTITVQVDNPGGTPVTVTTTTRAKDTFNSLAARLAAMGAPASVTAIAAANTASALIDPVAMPALPPPPVTLTGDFTPDATQGWRFAQPLFEIQVSLTLSRAAQLIDPAFLPAKQDDPPTAVKQAVSIIAPAARLAPGQAAAIGTPIRLAQFALDLEAAIPALRVANGKVLAGNQQTNDLWAVVFGVDGISKLSVAPTFDAGLASPCPWFFALRPLATDLISAGGLLIRPLVDGALSGAGVPTNVSGIDIEVWARAFLADFDRMLSAPYAAGLLRLNSATVRGRIDELIGNKAVLAGAIASGLDFVLTADTPLEPARRLSVIALLRQRLLASLTQGYGVSVVLQWDVTQMASPWVAQTVKLAGAPQQKTGSATNVSIGTTKIALDNQAVAGADIYVNATLSVTNGQQLGSVTVECDFAANEIEFAIADVPGVQGYQSSNWLRFVHPLSDNPPAGYAVNLGTVVAPLPLRSYPAMPQLKSQATPAEDPAATLVADAAKWRYVIDVAHPSVLQDELNYDIEVNLAPAPMAMAVAKDDLILQLAQYSAVASDLWVLLEALPPVQPDKAPDPVLEAAIGTFIDLAGRIATAWAGVWSQTVHPQVQAGDPTLPVYQRFALSSRLAASGGVLQSLTLTGDASAPGPGDWPDIAVGYQDRMIVLTQDKVPGSTRTYNFPADPKIPAAGDLLYQLSFKALPSGLFQNAKTAAAVVRNAHLMPPGGKDTREPFIYRTPFLSFADKATPLVVNSNRLPIASFTKSSFTALTTMFHDIFASTAAAQISVAVNYNFRLVEGGPGEPLAPSLPVLLMPRGTYSDGLPGQLAQALDTWQAANDPSKTGGEWQISVSLYSQIEPQLDRPILMLERIISPLPSADEKTAASVMRVTRDRDQADRHRDQL